MSNLSQDQVEKRAAIQKSATIWGGIVGVIAGLLALWILNGQGGAIRFGGAIVIALAVGYLVFRASFKSGAKSALCENCGAAFSRSRSDRDETLASSEEKEEREEQPDKSTKVTTWTEETYDVVDTYACAKCGDTNTKTYQTTRRRDETSVVEPHAPPPPPKAPAPPSPPKAPKKPKPPAAPASKGGNSPPKKDSAGGNKK